MAEAVVKRKLVVTADTSGLARGAQDVKAFGSGVTSTADRLKAMKAQLDPATYRAYAAGMKPAIEAERQMAQVTKAVTAELKPFAAEMRKAQIEALKASEALQKRALSEARAAEALRRTYDTGYANAAKFLEIEARVAKQIEKKNLTVDQGNAILAGAADRYKQMGHSAAGANDNVRLTTGQVQNLGYQLNDTATMLAMGASPFQIMASQAGQVVQALGDGPGGVKGSLSAIGSSIAGFARSIPTAGYAVAGVTAGVAALWYMTSGPEARAAEESLQDFEGAIKRIETGWKGAAEAASAYAKAPGRQGSDRNATYLDIQGSGRRLAEDLKARISDLNSSDLLSGRILRPFAGSVSDARREISALYGDLRQGEISAQQFADEMLRIRLDPDADDYARNFAEEIRLALPDVMALERQVQALNQAAAQLAAPKGTMGRRDLPNDVFTDRFGPQVGGDSRFGDSDGMRDIRDKLKDQREELEGVDKATRSYSDAVAEQKAQIAGTVAQLQLQIDTFGQSEGAIAAARFKMDAFAEAQRQANEAKLSAIDPALVAEINRQAAEVGRLTDQLGAQTTAQREATKAAEEFTRAREEAAREIERQRERVAEFTSDLQFERSIMGLSEAEQDVRNTLRNLGVDFESFDGQRLAGEMRYNDQLRETQDRLRETGEIGRDAFMSIFDALTQGGDVLDNVMGALGTMGGPIGGADQLFQENVA